MSYHILTQDILNFAYVITSKYNKSYLQGGECNNPIRITRGCNNVCRITWGVIWLVQNAAGNLHEIEYLVYHNSNVFLGKKIPEFTFSVWSVFVINVSLFTSVICFFQKDNGENMENAPYTTNDDTAGFINQMKNRNTSRKTDSDLKLIKNYFASIILCCCISVAMFIYISIHNMTLLHHIPY